MIFSPLRYEPLLRVTNKFVHKIFVHLHTMDECDTSARKGMKRLGSSKVPLPLKQPIIEREGKKKKTNHTHFTQIYRVIRFCSLAGNFHIYAGDNGNDHSIKT